MTPYEAYENYVALKLHFTSSKYDYFRYHGQVKNITPDTFDARNDVLHFRRIARHHDPLCYLVAHLVERPDAWIGDIARDKKPYYERRRVLDSLTRIFIREIKTIKLPEAIEVSARHHPKLLQEWLGRKISLETFIVVCDITGCTEKWKKIYTDDPAINLVIRAEKYLPFMKLFSHYEREKFKILLASTTTP